ncbi:MAG: sensor histidine kinase [Prosthecobacter sp.]|jgi:signal transduction histidine kinase|uniref:sensor histidine kinase n=1 Tax=Prosthecobacter sp. TaxID=1965333 RepID=UPI0019F3014C|nr:sensor histidine kinase [Prosthecobacter sp.]MBE2285355.1 sensor histidine kinase [Prosthecobacter sp.]
MKTGVLESISSSFRPAVPASRRRAGITQRMRAAPLWMALIVPVVVTMVMGWLDKLTGWEISLFIFYAVPIACSVWWSGPAAGILVSVLSGAVWYLANIESHPYETQLGFVWAMINREFYFGVVVFATAAVRNKQDADAEHIRMLEERRQLEQDIVRVSEHEQQRIGQDLHDGVCQHLAAIGCAARVLADELQAQNVAAARDAVMIEESIQQAVMEARNLAHGIFPVHVDRNGLSAALTDLASMTSRLTGVSIEVKEAAEVYIDGPETAMHLYRIAQEAVANAIRHSGATQLTISLSQVEEVLELRIEDNGSGLAFATGKTDAGMGLRTMQYRAQSLGAEFKIESKQGAGTTVLCRAPVH